MTDWNEHTAALRNSISSLLLQSSNSVHFKWFTYCIHKKSKCCLCTSSGLYIRKAEGSPHSDCSAFTCNRCEDSCFTWGRQRSQHTEPWKLLSGSSYLPHPSILLKADIGIYHNLPFSCFIYQKWSQIGSCRFTVVKRPWSIMLSLQPVTFGMWYCRWDEWSLCSIDTQMWCYHANGNNSSVSLNLCHEALRQLRSFLL